MNEDLINEKFKQYDKEIEKMDILCESIHTLVGSIKELVIEVKYIKEDQIELKENVKDQDNRIKNIEQQPADTYKSIKLYVLSTLLGALVTYILMKLGLK